MPQHIRKDTTAKEQSRLPSARCLVTGFDAFGELSSNPSQLVTECLPTQLTVGREGLAIAIKQLILPTCCQESWDTLSKSLRSKSDKPDFLIMTGLAEDRTHITLERFALNIRDYRVPDNQKHQPMDQPIDDHGPAAYKSCLPLGKIAKQLSNKGFPCDVSDHAGSFVCNDVYYRSLRFQQTQGYPHVVLFMHLPLPKTFAKTITETGGKRSHLSDANHRHNQLEPLKAAVVEIIKICCQLC